MPSFIISSAAKQDVINTVDYLNGIDKGLTKQFLEDVEHCYDQIETFPLSFQEHLDSIRMAVLSRFSHKVFYEVYEDKIIILSIPHTSREEAKYLSPSSKNPSSS